jgi:adenine deaminase
MMVIVFAELYSLIDKAAKEAGSTLISPIHDFILHGLACDPSFKISDKGLFDADSFRLTCLMFKV